MATVLITGATSGFGEACARKFAENNYSVILTGRRKDRLDKISSELTSNYKINVHTLLFDVQKRDEVLNAINSIPEKFRMIDVLINNAGLALGRDYFDEADLDDWDTMIDTNVKGVMYVTRAVIPLMIKTGKGHIINIGSIAGKEVYEKGNVYCASKFAIDALSKSMRIDLLRHGIKVTALNPGAAETEFSIVRFKGDVQTAQKVYEGYKPLTAADVADVAFYTTSVPDHVCINDITMTPTAQASAVYFHKDQ